MSSSMTIDIIMKTRPGSGVMFDAIASKYDLLNEILSLGRHKRWRSDCIRRLDINQNDKILDLAAGTFDISIEIANKYKNVQILAAEPSVQMINFGKKKLLKKEINTISPFLAAAENLPFKAGSINTCIVSFGVRNFENREKGLKEIYEVLVEDGELAILELLLPEKGFFSFCARIYIKKLLPLIGSLFSSKAEYNYLQNSITEFPRKDQFLNELEKLGFKIVLIQKYMFGACHLFLCKKTS